MERSTAGMKKRSPVGLSLPNQNTINNNNKHNMVVLYKICKKYHEI